MMTFYPYSSQLKNFIKKLNRIAVLILLTLAHTRSFGQTAQTKDLDLLKNEKDPRIIREKISHLTQSTSEKDWVTVVQYYGSTNQRARRDSLAEELIKHFPNGEYAVFHALVNLKYEKNGAGMAENLKAMKKKFPNMKRSDRDEAENMVAIRYAEEHNTAKAIEHLHMIKNDADAYTVGNDFLIYDAQAAEKIVKPELNHLKQILADSMNNLQDKEKIAEYKYDYYAYTALYSKILIKLKNYKSAISYAKEAYENRSEDQVDDGSASYGYLLSLNGKYKEALPVLEELYINGKSNEKLNSQLKIAYQRLNPGKNGAAFLLTLQSSLMQKLEDGLLKKMQNRQAPDFYITDSFGKKVSLSDFTGKTIVLDFWATWCAPCKASFPAMQSTVNRYKNDPKVAFLFIHTWEASTTPLADAEAYLRNNQYHLPLYLDAKDPKSRVNPAVTAFNVGGIPAKFVIDGKGKIRFQLTGFASGQDAANVNELSAMIELAKKNS